MRRAIRKYSILIVRRKRPKPGRTECDRYYVPEPGFKNKSKCCAGRCSKGIPVESLPTGILIITVFDKQWNAIAERITYVNNREYIFQPEMEVKHWGLSKRARNEIQVTVPDSIVANLSICRNRCWH